MMNQLVAARLWLSMAVASLAIPTLVCQGSRERISDYVALKQQFLVVNSNILLFEDPEANVVATRGNVYWMGPPSHAPDENDDGQFDNVIAHALTFRIDTLTALKEEGATVSGTWTPHGYAATWTGERYDEYLVDYDDSSLHFITEHEEGVATITGVETSDKDGTGGFVLSGDAFWVDETNDSVREMAAALGVEDLTPEVFNSTYAKVWEESKSK